MLASAAMARAQILVVDDEPTILAMNRIGLDTYTDHREQFEGERPWRTANGQTSGGSLQGRYSRTGLQNDLILNLAHTFVGRGITVSIRRPRPRHPNGLPVASTRPLISPLRLKPRPPTRARGR